MAQQAVFDAQAVTVAVAEGIARIENASSTEELKAIKTQYAGADSAMTQASKAIGTLPADQKKDAGKLMGKLRADFGRAFGARETELKAEEEARIAEIRRTAVLPTKEEARRSFEAGLRDYYGVRGRYYGD